MDVVVRPATIEDARAIAAAHIDAWRQAYVGLVPQSLLDGLSVEDGARRWAERLAALNPSTRQCVVADVDGAVRGFAAVGPSRDDDAPPTTGQLYAIYLAPDLWGRGVGHLLHERAVAELRSLGMSQATLWVLGTNARSRRFYERHGWRHDVVDEVVVKDDVPLPATRYRIDLEGQ